VEVDITEVEVAQDAEGLRSAVCAEMLRVGGGVHRHQHSTEGHGLQYLFHGVTPDR
jgi:hypothetical protein